jgi:cell pole-organizing protein PopZ
MTQPAKVQEPSMEEILASIRRIIADDEAKPPAPEKPAAAVIAAKPAAAAPAAKPAPTKDIPTPAPASQAVPAKAPASPKPAPALASSPPAPVVSNSQDDIDALLNGLDEATSPEQIRPPLPDPEVFDLTDDMAVAPTEPPRVSFQRVELQDDVEFTETVASRASHRQPAFEPPVLESGSPVQQILSRSTVSAVESAFNSLAHTVLSNNARTLEDLVKEMLRPMLKSWLDDNLPGLVERIVKAEIERVSRGR